VPKRSVTAPKRLVQKVSAKGMVTVPPSDRAAKMRSDSATVARAGIIAVPAGFSYWPGILSDAIAMDSPMVIHACRILVCQSGGACSAIGVPAKCIIFTILAPRASS